MAGPGEAAGLVPDSAWKRRTVGEDWLLGDTYTFGIGQGYLTTSLVQMAALTAGIANGGEVPVPRVVRGVERGGRARIEPLLDEIENARRALDVAEAKHRPIAQRRFALDRALAQLGAVALEPKAAALPAQELWLAPGIHMRRLWRDGANKARAYYLRVGAGRALPHHGHDGAEMTCVLSGAFWDGGVRYGAGDFVEASAAHSHQPRVDESGECICLIGSDSPPRGHGLAELVMRLRM